jgi:hypothetical protein
MIDTLDLAERLRAGGFTEQQARTAAGAFGHAPGQQFASKADIDALRLSTRADLDRFGVDLRAELQKGTGALRVELHKEMRDLAWKMAGLRGSTPTSGPIAPAPARWTWIGPGRSEGRAMPTNLSPQFIKALAAPASGNRVEWDTQEKGLGVRVTAAGACAFVLRYVVQGRERRMTLGDFPALTLTAARQIARQRKGEIARGADPLAVKAAARGALTLGRAVESYLAAREAGDDGRAALKPRSRSRKHGVPLNGTGSRCTGCRSRASTRTGWPRGSMPSRRRAAPSPPTAPAPTSRPYSYGRLSVRGCGSRPIQWPPPAPLCRRKPFSAGGGCRPMSFAPSGRRRRGRAATAPSSGCSS